MTRTLLRIAAALLAPVLMLAACNSDEHSDDTDTGYAPPTDVAVTGFALKSNDRVLKDLDSVYFSIDLQKAVIFNADSLPKGTDVTKLVPEIKYSSHITSAIIEMTGGKVREGSVDYRRQPGDSIDFSGRVTLTLTTSSGNARSYELKVNVHNADPDSLCWGNTAQSKLPSRLANPRQQRTVQMSDKVACMLQEADGSYTLSLTSHPETAEWSRKTLSLPFSPRLRTLTAVSDRLYLLGTDGKLHSSADLGNTWTSHSETWTNIVGAYGGQLLGLRQDASGYTITSLSDAIPEFRLAGDLAGFPIEDYTNLYCYQSQWMQAPIAVIGGGVDREGKVSNRIYGFDGNSWVLLSEGQIPALRGATFIPYFSYLKTTGVWTFTEFSTLMLSGGISAEGEFNKDLYLSYNNGVNFTKGPQLMQMPSFIPGMWESDAVVASIPKSASLNVAAWNQMPEQKLPGWYRVATEVNGSTITWECPYIYLFGGADAEGHLYDTIWRGVINRLTFTPII